MARRILASLKCYKKFAKNTTTWAKHVKKWVEGCETCARDNRVPNNTIKPELLNLPEWDFGPEDGMQIDI